MQFEPDRSVVARPPTTGWGPFGEGPVELFGPLSPELALVSPELAAVARAFLPDRPWEAFLSRGAVEAVTRPADVSAIPRTAVAVGQKAGVDHVPGATSEPASRDSPRRRRAIRHLQFAAAAAFTALLVASSLPIVRNAPTLETASLSPSPSEGPTRIERGTEPPSASSFRRPVGGAVSPIAPRPTKSAKRPSAPKVPRAPEVTARTSPAATEIAPLPGGYVAPVVRFRLPVSAAFLVDVAVLTRCGSGPPLPKVAVGRGGSFARTVTAGSATVTLAGRFVGGNQARGVVRVVNGGCSSGPVPFAAHLS